jgi:hypothetical protein
MCLNRKKKIDKRRKKTYKKEERSKESIPASLSISPSVLRQLRGLGI